MTIQMLIALVTGKLTLGKILGDFEKVQGQLKAFVEDKQREHNELEEKASNCRVDMARANNVLGNFKALVGDND